MSELNAMSVCKQYSSQLICRALFLVVDSTKRVSFPGRWLNQTGAVSWLAKQCCRVRSCPVSRATPPCIANSLRAVLGQASSCRLKSSSWSSAGTSRLKTERKIKKMKSLQTHPSPTVSRLELLRIGVWTYYYYHQTRIQICRPYKTKKKYMARRADFCAVYSLSELGWMQLKTKQNAFCMNKSMNVQVKWRVNEILMNHQADKFLKTCISTNVNTRTISLLW